VPCESLDAPDNLPKKSRRQVALRQLQDEVPGVSGHHPRAILSDGAAEQMAGEIGGFK
jgi:hypothetical protein